MIETRYTKANAELCNINHKICMLEKEKAQAEEELKKYCKRHRSLSFDTLKTGDVDKLKQIYSYFDNNKEYIIEWEGGLRCDDRGMKLCFWVNDDAEYLVIHITSDHNNVIFSGSTSWIIKAPTLEDKVNVIKKIKADITKIINAKQIKL